MIAELVTCSGSESWPLAMWCCSTTSLNTLTAFTAAAKCLGSWSDLVTVVVMTRSAVSSWSCSCHRDTHGCITRYDAYYFFLIFISISIIQFFKALTVMTSRRPWLCSSWPISTGGAHGWHVPAPGYHQDYHDTWAEACVSTISSVPVNRTEPGIVDKQNCVPSFLVYRMSIDIV